MGISYTNSPLPVNNAPDTTHPPFSRAGRVAIYCDRMESRHLGGRFYLCTAYGISKIPQNHTFHLRLRREFCYTLTIGTSIVFLQLCGFFRSGGLNR